MINDHYEFLLNRYVVELGVAVGASHPIGGGDVGEGWRLELADGRTVWDGITNPVALKHLRSLNLDTTRVTDAGLKELTRLPQLETLDLGHHEHRFRGKGNKPIETEISPV
jgi:hypothetical protein